MKWTVTSLQNRIQSSDPEPVQNQIGSATLIAEGKNLLKNTDRPDRVRANQAVDPNSLITQHARTNMRKFSYDVRVVESWNSLDQDTRNCVGKRKFKAKIATKPSMR